MEVRPGARALAAGKTGTLETVARGSNERNEGMTYGELMEAARGVAAALKERGSETNAFVGLLAERSMEMIIGLLGILEAGCAYVPLNPHAPAARNAYMLAECGTKLLVTTRQWGRNTGFIDNVDGLSCLCLEDCAAPAPGQKKRPLQERRAHLPGKEIPGIMLM